MTTINRRFAQTLAIITLALFTAIAQAQTQPRNVIIFIGDGMGPEHVKAAGLYAFGDAYPETEKFSFEKFPYHAFATTYAANAEVTDSAAAASALATGSKVDNSVISLNISSEVHWKQKGRRLETILETLQAQGKKTGLVSSAHITHATPAAFAAHESTRYNYDDIGHDILTQTRPAVLLAGGGNGVSPEKATVNGYYVVTSRAAMLALDTSKVYQVSGQFGLTNLPYEYDEDFAGLPHLSEMTDTAIKILDNAEEGFFLMVEGGKIDHAAHKNNIERNVYETLEFAKAIQVAIDYAADRDDTLIIVTADHETGGMAVVKGNGKGEFPEVTWSTKGHTAANVTVSAIGPNAEQVKGIINNTDIPSIAKGMVIEARINQALYD